MNSGPAEPLAGPRRARVAVLTPEGRGAIAVVRVWGPGAIEAADAAFRPATGRRLAETRPGLPRFGWIGAGEGDEVVAVVIPGEPPEVEIHGHGGVAAVGLVIEALTIAGAERRQPVAWVRYDARSLIEAEACVDLARAPTLRTAEILLEQAEGAFERELARIVSLTENDPQQALARIDRLLDRADFGLRLTRGWTVVLAGRPNVGKSALFNALAGYERAIVAPTPGTTRDVVSLRTAFDGWPVELSDTAGLHAADDAVEAEGIELARVRQAGDDLTVLVLDRSQPLTEADHTLMRERPDALFVASKSDLQAAWSPDALSRTIECVSSVTGAGIDRLAGAIALRLIPDVPPPGSAVPFRPGHARRLQHARDALHAGDRAAAVTSLEALPTMKRGDRSGDP